MAIFKFLNSFFDTILPEYCLGCQLRGQLLCQECLQNITPARYQENDNIFSAFDYRDPVIRKALWELKYKNKKKLAKIVGQALYGNLIEEISEIKAFSPGKPLILIPIPLSKKRQKERGYNQAQLMANALAQNAPPDLFEINNNLIKRIRETPPQAKINNRKKRLENIKGAFALNIWKSDFQNSRSRKPTSQTIRGRTIIVVDDISTTGGTLLEVMKLLKKAGAKKVLGFAVAH